MTAQKGLPVNPRKASEPVVSHDDAALTADAARGALSRDAGITLSEQLAARYAERIGQRLLTPGARLPSVRECARRHGVSASTVVAAYDRLLAQGLVEARRQRGFFVRTSSRVPGAARTQGTASRVAPIDATALIRGMFHHADTPASPGLGTLPPDWLDASLLETSLRRVLAQRSPTQGLRYGDPAGDARLRSALSVRLAGLGLDAAAAQIVTTVGATHALDIVSRTLLQPGDAVLVDEPGWAVEFARLSRMGIRLLPVPRGSQGPDLDVMRTLIQAHRPRLYVTVSVLHNPTGASLSSAMAHRVLELAHAHDLWVVEDDTYAHFAAPHAPRLAALDALRRTVYVGGFSKILAPGWRVGFLAAPTALVDRLVDTKLLGTLTTPALLEQAVAHCLEHGLLRRHADRVAARLDAARSRSVRRALDAGCRFVAPPQGLFGWIDVGVDTDRLSQLMLDAGWLLAPGSLFHALPRPTSLMRINFATSQAPAFWSALHEARSALAPT